jgi:hypothetical protein
VGWDQCGMGSVWERNGLDLVLLHWLLHFSAPEIFSAVA